MRQLLNGFPSFGLVCSGAIVMLAAAVAPSWSLASRPTASPGIQLGNGEEQVSALAAGGSATFDFAIQSAGTVIVSIGEVGNMSAEPVVEVFDGNDVLVASASSNGSDVRVQFTTLETGVFQIVVTDNGDNEPMDFRIRAVALPNPPMLISDRDQTLQNGEQIESDFPLGSFAIFPFQVDSPGSLRISVGRTEGSAEPVAQLFSPSGTLLGDDLGNDHAFIELTSFETGTYYVVVSDGNNDEPLNFQMRVFSLPGELGLIGGRDHVVANGEEVQSSFPLGSFNVFPFHVDQAGTVIVGVGETGAGLPANPFLSVFSPSGELVVTNSSANDAFVIFQSFETGTFTIVVAESATNDAMDFRIRALSLPGNPTLLESVDQPLQNGMSVDSSIPIGGFAIFPFFLDEAGLVTVNVGETGAGLVAEPFLRVYDPSGTLVDDDSGNSDATVQFTSFFTGVYMAVVADGSNDEEMSFNIVATGISNTPPGTTGDINGDGFVDLLDVAPFVQLVSNGQFQPEADINQDGVVDLLDVAPFVDLLIGF